MTGDELAKPHVTPEGNVRAAVIPGHGAHQPDLKNEAPQTRQPSCDMAADQAGRRGATHLGRGGVVRRKLLPKSLDADPAVLFGAVGRQVVPQVSPKAVVRRNERTAAGALIGGQSGR